MIEFFLDHTDFTGTVLSTYRPVEPSYSFVLSDAGVFNCKFAHTQLDVDEVAIAADEFAPKRTDYLLKLTDDGGDTYVDIQAGFAASVGVGGNSGVITYAGEDWLAWLDQPYPFEGYNIDPDDWVATDVVKYWIATSQEDIINDLMLDMYDGTLETIELIPSFTGTGWTEVLEFHFELGDTTSVLEHIRSLASQSPPYGFDFVVMPDKTVPMFAPRRTVDADEPTIVDLTWDHPAVIDVPNWNNSGPDATVTIGAPPAFPGFKGYSTYGPSRTQYRRWMRINSLGEAVRSQAMTDRVTDAVGTLDRFPKKQINIEVNPEEMMADPKDFYSNQCGKTISFDSEDVFGPYHRINATYWITSQEFKLGRKDGPRCMLTLDQIYETTDT